jgi:hypothetical protein
LDGASGSTLGWSGPGRWRSSASRTRMRLSSPLPVAASASSTSPTWTATLAFSSGDHDSGAARRPGCDGGTGRLPQVLQGMAESGPPLPGSERLLQLGEGGLFGIEAEGLGGLGQRRVHLLQLHEVASGHARSRSHCRLDCAHHRRGGAGVCLQRRCQLGPGALDAGHFLGLKAPHFVIRS